MSKDSLGDRMKKHELVPRSRLISRMPVIARIDGRAFHSFTRKFAKPWDEKLHGFMWETAIALCNDIQGARIAYVQSDEISLLIADYYDLDTVPWFDYQVQKMCSVAASVATGAFIKAYMTHLASEGKPIPSKMPAFDARFWNVPKEEVCNYFLWRQQDASRNSLSMHASSHYSATQLHAKRKADRHELLHKKGINWDKLPTPQKRGVCIVKEIFSVPAPAHYMADVLRARWVVDRNIPLFDKDRDYINKLVMVEPEPRRKAA